MQQLDDISDQFKLGVVDNHDTLAIIEETKALLGEHEIMRALTATAGREPNVVREEMVKVQASLKALQVKSGSMNPIVTEAYMAGLTMTPAKARLSLGCDFSLF